MLDLHLHHTVHTSVRPTPRVCQVAAMFGLGVDDQRTLDLIPPTDLTLSAGQVIFITGASGGGKTTLLRAVADQLTDHPEARVIDFQQLPLVEGNRPPGEQPALVDALPGSLEDATRRLALAGLNDAFVMLRRPAELSDGQRYRFRLARLMAEIQTTSAGDGPPLHVVLADEFGSTLDRATAAILARNVRKWVTRQSDAGPPVCFLAATTHDDLLEPLEPDTLIVQHPGEAMQVAVR